MHGRARHALVCLVVVAATAPALAAPGWLLPDPLKQARQHARAGEAREAAALAQATGTPAGNLLAGLSLVEAGDDAAAIERLREVPAGHPLVAAAELALVGAYRRQGLTAEARRLVERMLKRKVPGATYLLADVEMAAGGCKALKAWKNALMRERRHRGRHAARRGVLTCSTDAIERMRTALAMMDDSEPVDSELARDALSTWARSAVKGNRFPLDLLMSVCERLLFEGLVADAARVVELVPAPGVPEARARLALIRGRVLLSKGDKAGHLALLRRTLQEGAGAMEPAIARSVLDAELAGGPSEASVAGYLAFAERYPDDAVGVEARHLAAYHLSEAGKLNEAIVQWDRVASIPGNRRRDAGWFAAQKLAQTGKLVEAAARAIELSRRDRDGGFSAQFSYWAARWMDNAGRAREARTQYEETCRKWPGRLHGRFACRRSGSAGPPPVVQPVADDAFEALVSLARHPQLPKAAVGHVERAAVLAQAGAGQLALDELRAVSSTMARADSQVALGYGAAALALDDANIAVVLAERRRGLVEPLDQPGWLLLAYPRPALLVQAARSEGMDEDLVLAIARTESWFSPSVRSRAGAVGLMQVMPKTAAQLAGRDGALLDGRSLWDPETNVSCGSRYLKLLSADFGARVELLACGYNAGPNATRRFIDRGRGLPLDAFLESINYRETRGYAKRVLEAYLMYRALRGLSADIDPDDKVDVNAGSSIDF